MRNLTRLIQCLSAAVVLPGALAVFSTVHAYGATWVGAATDGNWSTTTNWDTGDVPDTAAEDAIVDNNSGQATVLTYTVSSVSASVDNPTLTSIGNLTVSAGDTLTISKGSDGKYAKLVINGALSNSGTLTFGGEASNANGQALTVVVTGGAGGIVNTASGVLNFNSISGSRPYRTGLTTYNLQGNNTNNGNITVANKSDQGAGKVQVVLTGSGETTFTNNGTIQVQGKGDNTNPANINTYQPWAIFGPGDSITTLTLAGTGTLNLASNLSSHVSSFAILSGLGAGKSLVNTSGHTISGNGYIGYDGVNGQGGNNQITLYKFSTLTNQGLIKAMRGASATAGLNDTLSVQPQGGHIINDVTGRMVAAGNAGTILSIGSNTIAATFTNNGLLEARTGNTIILGSALNKTLNGEIRGGGKISSVSFSFSDSAILTPGDSAHDDGTGLSGIGTLTLAGDVSLSAGTILNWQAGDSSAAGISYDSIAVTGSLILDGVLNISALSGFNVGTYHLLTAGSIVDNGLTFGVMPAGYDYSVVVDHTSGSVDLVVAAVPEPAAAGLLVAGSLFLLRRRK